MSRIKDMFVTENGIEDLMPTETLTDRIVLSIDKSKLKEDLIKMRIVERCEDGIEWLGYEEDVETLCESAVDIYIRENALDIDDVTYQNEVTIVKARLLDELHQWHDESMAGLETMVDDDREMRGDVE